MVFFEETYVVYVVLFFFWVITCVVSTVRYDKKKVFLCLGLRNDFWAKSRAIELFLCPLVPPPPKELCGKRGGRRFGIGVVNVCKRLFVRHRRRPPKVSKINVCRREHVWRWGECTVHGRENRKERAPGKREVER